METGKKKKISYIIAVLFVVFVGIIFAAYSVLKEKEENLNNSENQYKENCWLETEEGKKFLKEDNTITIGWFEWEDKWYYSNSHGIVQTGPLFLYGNTYLMGEDGSMLMGWQEVGGDWWYLRGSGSRVLNDWAKYDTDWYYILSNGKLAAGWCEINGYWYFFEPDGRMVTGWKYEEDAWYYLRSGGSMVCGDKIRTGGYDFYFDEQGRWIKDSKSS